MTIRILVNGAFGRMGQITTKMITEHPEFELVGQTGREYDLKKSIIDSKAQVVIDFTRPESVFENTKMIIEADARPVIGTSGLKSEQIQTLQKKAESKKLGGIIAPNFSLGAVLMMKAAREIARYMPHAEIIELHHPNKVDSPSGTAMRTAEMLAETLGDHYAAPKVQHETVKGARGASVHGIPVHAVRLPGFLAHLEVLFGNTGETLSLRHDSLDRLSFMPGIALACQKVMALDRLVYGLEEVL